MNRCNSFQTVFRFATTCLLLALLTSFANAQMFGMPPAQTNNAAWEEIIGLVPEEEPIACVIWNEAGQLDPEGNASEKWFSDIGLQKSLGKLKEAIVKVAAEQGPPLVARFGQDIGWKLFSKAGVLVFENLDSEKRTGNGSLIFRLGEDEKLVQAFVNDLMAEIEFESKIIGESKIYLAPESPVPVAIGIHSGHLIAAIGDGQWRLITERIDEKKAAPEWLTKRLETVSVARRGQFMFGSLKTVLEMMPSEITERPEFKRVSDTLALDKIDSVSVCSGADSTSNISVFHLECDKEQGLASVINVPKIEQNKLKEMPADSISATAIRFSPSTIMELVRAIVPAESFDEAMAEMLDETGVDLERDIVDHLEGTVRYYLSGIVINPKQVAIVRIKDELKFQDSFKKMNDMAKVFAQQQRLEFYEQEKKGLQVYGIKSDTFSGFWAVHQGELYVSTNSRAISSHIRKAASNGKSSVLGTELASQILSDSKSLGLDGPILIQHYDIDQITETVLPLLQGAMAFIPPEVQTNFDFGPNDFPPIESMLGLRSTHSMVFKSPTGYTGISRYDTPIPLEFSSIALSGVAVGMLLPAVQQVREAARRTQSMNNQRQVVLALLNYEAANGEFPPAYTVDADGNPLLSWRVAILPYLDQQELYDKFHHDEPWDSEHNIKLLEQMPLSLKNPSTGGQPGWTDYVTPMSDDSILTPGVATGFDSIADGSSNTIMVMEVGASQQVPWTSPTDIEIDTLENLELDNGHPATVLVTMADGSVHSISKFTAIEAFIQATKKSDGGSMDLGQ